MVNSVSEQNTNLCPRCGKGLVLPDHEICASCAIARPEFTTDLVGFSTFPNMVEVVLTVSPEYDIKYVVSGHLHKDGSRLITLVFRPVKPELGRRGYELKQKWEQKPK